jgi:hypothetical protein
MFLELRRRDRSPVVPILSVRALALRIEDEDRRLDLAALQQNGHWSLQCLDRRLKDQNTLAGNQPARVILNHSPLHAERRTPHPGNAQKGSKDSTYNDGDRCLTPWS